MRVGIVMVRVRLLAGVTRMGKRQSSDHHWLGPGIRRGYWDGSSAGSASSLM